MNVMLRKIYINGTYSGIAGSAYPCFLPDLGRFTVSYPEGPDFLFNFLSGWGGIRTRGTGIARTQHFQCCSFGHSDTHPKLQAIKYYIIYSKSELLQVLCFHTHNFKVNNILFLFAKLYVD